MQISSNTILITGGGTGIGFALAEQFSKLENEVIICGRREKKLREAKEKLPLIHINVCDLSQENVRKDFAKLLIRKFPRLNILINNAGIQQRIDLKKADEINRIREEIEVNLLAPIHLSALLIPHLKEKKEAAIINISSGLAFAPIAAVPIYCVSKAAIHSYSLSLRHQLAKTSIKVFEIIPPIVDTELDKGKRDIDIKNRAISPEEFAKQSIEVIKNDVYESAIGAAEYLRSKREELFSGMNR